MRSAAAQTGVGERTLSRWLAWYRVGGLDSVLARVPGHAAVGLACRLTAEQQAALLVQSAKGAFRTYEEARLWLGAEYGIAYTYKGMYAVLARLGAHPKVPRPTAAKGDRQAQDAWEKGALARRSAPRG